MVFSTFAGPSCQSGSLTNRKDLGRTILFFERLLLLLLLLLPLPRPVAWPESRSWVHACCSTSETEPAVYAKRSLLKKVISHARETPTFAGGWAEQ